jgi:hypothetical protein
MLLFGEPNASFSKMIAQRRYLFSLLPFVLAFLVTLLQAQSIPRREDTDRLLREALQKRNLESAGNAPFHMKAKVHCDFQGSTKKGVYELLWAAPNRFRETVQFDDVVETDYALGDKIHISCTTQTIAPHITHLQYLVRHPLSVSD